jgi:alkylation response protein AidB-like acyl-CoA dehydrogenase
VSTDLLEDFRTTTRQVLSAGGNDVVDQLDLVGLLISSEAGGLGMGEREMVLVGEEIGRRPAPSAFLPTTVLAATLLTDPGTKPSKPLTHKHYAVALAAPDGAWTQHAPGVTATAGDGWLLDGIAWGLTTPTDPDAVLTAATTDAGVALFAVDADAATLTAANEFDPGRGLVEARFDRAQARLVARPPTASRTIGDAYRRALLAVAAEQLGVARACLESSVDYAKTRTQFGAPIGSFQAIKHRCAEALLATEFADAVLQHAVDTGIDVDAELAFVVASRAAVSGAESCIHIHGGIGFTWEHSAHRYLRRARVNATLLGPMGLHRDAIAESAGVATTGGR